MSTLTTHTTASRDTHSIGLCKFNTTSRAIEVSDGTNWFIYDYDYNTEYTNRYQLNFDGSGDYATTGYYQPSGTAFSYSFWTKSSDTTSSMAWLASTNSAGDATAARFNVLAPSSTKAFYAIVSNGSSVYANTSIGGTNSTLAIRDGDWHHVVFSINGTAIKIWIDGGSGGSPTHTATSTVSYVGNAPNSMTLGRLGDYGAYYLNGSLDEVALFEYELSATQVANIYNSGAPVHVGTDNLNLSPSGYWRGGDDDNGTGSTVTDLGSGGNDATLSGNAAIAAIGTGESIYV